MGIGAMKKHAKTVGHKADMNQYLLTLTFFQPRNSSVTNRASVYAEVLGIKLIPELIAVQSYGLLFFIFIFIFSVNGSPLKAIKNVFYFIKKALFVLEIFNFLLFFPFFSTLSRFKRTNRSQMVSDAMNVLA